MKLWVETEGLLRAPDDKPARLSVASASDRGGDIQRSRDNTLDLRGMRVDDALTLVESFVDRMHTTDARVGYVLHGHGTGALRDAVRKHLKTVVSDVREVQAAERDDGGDAVTVFRLGALSVRGTSRVP
jgi:DNA mismatch repair protein MutS2